MSGNIIIGNLCGLLAMDANACSSTRKTAKSVLTFQNMSRLSRFAIFNVVICDVVGAVSDTVVIITTAIVLLKGSRDARSQ